MEILAGIIYSAIITVQSLVCIISSCRTNDRIDELKDKLEKISKNASIRIIRLETAQYYSNPSRLMTSPEPLPSAPDGMYYSQPKTYVAPQHIPQPTTQPTPQTSSQPTVYGSL